MIEFLKRLYCFIFGHNVMVIPDGDPVKFSMTFTQTKLRAGDMIICERCKAVYWTRSAEEAVGVQ